MMQCGDGWAMPKSRMMALWLPAIAVATVLAGQPSTAGAQNLFETLFGGGIKKKKHAGEFPPPPPAERKVVKPAKISAPSYYTYKVEPLVRVDFSRLVTPTAVPVAFDPYGRETEFRMAVGGLQDYALSAEKEIAKALVDHYGANPAFLWVEQGAPNAKAREAIRVLGDAATHGLEPSDYAVAAPAGGDDAALVRFEMALSARVLRYVEDAVRGRVDPNRISGYHDLPRKTVDFAAALNALANAGDVRTYLESRHPQSPEYQALRVELESLKASAENEIVVDPKLLLKPGQTSTELPKLLHLIGRDLDDEMGGEFGEVLWRNSVAETYSEELVPVIKAAQKKAGLSADGVVGPRTVAALAGVSKVDRLEKVTLALEEIRWLPSELGSPRVFINQPAFTASYFEGQDEKLKMRVVVGAAGTQTAFFYDEIEQVDYNPYWGVPQSIIVNEMMPRLMRDPGYLDRAGYEVTDARGKRIPSSAINWGAYGSKIPYNVRQTPSEDNALGELKILFPNKHAIYMHDTPSKQYFQRDARALSHGCVRLQDPRGMAAAVLGQSRDYVAAKIKAGHSSEKVTRKVAVYLGYFTAWPNAEGRVEYFGDVYGRDDHLKTAIEKTEAVRAPAA